MTLDLSILLTVISVSFAVLLGVLGLRRNNKQDDQKETDRIWLGIRIINRSKQ